MSGALVIMPTPSRPRVGPLAVWITAAGWAAAARRRWGHSWVLTPDGVLSPEEVLRSATEPSGASEPVRQRRSRLYGMASTFSKDIRSFSRALHSRNSALQGPWTETGLTFVWQHHELFQRSGFRAARRFGVPLVLFVDAPVVWEMEQWNALRPGWGRALEGIGEAPQLREADLVLCVSDVVAEQVHSLGASQDRVLVTPCATDPDLFSPVRTGSAVRRRLGLEDRFVVGWTGSFRSFHAVDLAIQAVEALKASHPDLRLLLVGDGPEKARVERLVEDLGLAERVVFTGLVGFEEVPEYVAAMDVCLVLHSGSADFHYSPLKLKEYQSAGKPVVAPRVVGREALVRNRVDGLLVDPGDADQLAKCIQRLADDPALRERLGAAGRQAVLQTGTWDHQLLRAENRLVELGLIRRRAVAASSPAPAAPPTGPWRPRLSRASSDHP